MSILDEKKEMVHFGSVKNLCFSPEFDFILSLGQDDENLFILNSNNLVDASISDITDKLNDSVIKAIELFERKQVILCGGDQKILFLVEISSSSENKIEDIFQFKNKVHFISTNHTNDICLVVCENNIVFFDFLNRKVIDEMFFEKNIQAAEFSPDGMYFLIKFVDMLCVYEYNTKNNVLKVENDIKCFCWAHMHYLYYSEKGGCITVNTLETSINIEISNISCVIMDISISKNGNCSLITDDKKIYFTQLNFDNLEEINILFFKEVDIEFPVIVKWNDDILVCGDCNGTVFLWRPKLPKNINADTLRVQETHKNESNISMNKGGIEKNMGSLRLDESKYLPASKKKEKNVKDNKRQKSIDFSNVKKIDQVKKIKFVEKHDSGSNDDTQDKDISMGEESDIDGKDDKKTNDSKPVETNTSFLSSDSGNEDENYNKIETNNINNKFLDSSTDESINEKNEIENKFENNKVNTKQKINYLSDNDSLDENVEKDEDNKPHEMKQKTLDSYTDQVSLYYDNYIETSTKPFMPGSFHFSLGEKRLIFSNANGYLLLNNADKVLEVISNDESEFKSRVIERPNILSVRSTALSDVGVLLCFSDTIVFDRHKGSSNEKEMIINISTGEIPYLCALGSTWFAVSTLSKRINIFTFTGIFIHMYEACGEVMAMNASESFLIVIFGIPHRYEILDIEKTSLVSTGYLPIRQPLKYVGFDSNETAFVQSGDQTLYMFSKMFGGIWTPVLNISKYIDTSSEDYFISYISDDHVYGVTYLFNSPITIPINNFNVLDIQPTTLDPSNSLSVKLRLEYFNSNDDETREERLVSLDKELLRQYLSALFSKKPLLAVQIGSLIKLKANRELAIEQAELNNETVSTWLIRNWKKEQKNTPDYSEEPYFVPSAFDISCIQNLNTDEISNDIKRSGSVSFIRPKSTPVSEKTTFFNPIATEESSSQNILEPRKILHRTPSRDRFGYGIELPKADESISNKAKPNNLASRSERTTSRKSKNTNNRSRSTSIRKRNDSVKQSDDDDEEKNKRTRKNSKNQSDNSLSSEEESNKYSRTEKEDNKSNESSDEKHSRRKSNKHSKRNKSSASVEQTDQEVKSTKKKKSSSKTTKIDKQLKKSAKTNHALASFGFNRL